MRVTTAERSVARSMYAVAVSMIVARETDDEVRGMAINAESQPSATTIRALIAAGHGKPWMPSLTDAMAEVGIAAAADILGD